MGTVETGFRFALCAKLRGAIAVGGALRWNLTPKKTKSANASSAAKSLKDFMLIRPQSVAAASPENRHGQSLSLELALCGSPGYVPQTAGKNNGILDAQG